MHKSKTKKQTNEKITSHLYPPWIIYEKLKIPEAPQSSIWLSVSYYIIMF